VPDWRVRASVLVEPNARSLVLHRWDGLRLRDCDLSHIPLTLRAKRNTSNVLGEDEKVGSKDLTGYLEIKFRYP